MAWTLVCWSCSLSITCGSSTCSTSLCLALVIAVVSLQFTVLLYWVAYLSSIHLNFYVVGIFTWVAFSYSLVWVFESSSLYMLYIRTAVHMHTSTVALVYDVCTSLCHCPYSFVTALNLHPCSSSMLWWWAFVVACDLVLVVISCMHSSAFIIAHPGFTALTCLSCDCHCHLISLWHCDLVHFGTAYLYMLDLFQFWLY